MRRPRKNTGYVDSYVEIDGVEFDVRCAYRTWPAEADTNTASGFEVESAYHEDEGCILDLLSDDEVDALEERVSETLNSMGECEQ